jgi:hypothetical protein
VNIAHGQNKVVCDLVRILGLVPGQCQSLTLNFTPGSVISADVRMMPTVEQLQQIVQALEPIAEGIVVRLDTVEKSDFVRIDREAVDVPTYRIGR